MIALTHRLAPFQALLPSNPAEYGFNCFQAAIDPWTAGDADAVTTWIEGCALGNMGVLLAITPKPTAAYFTGGAGPLEHELFQNEIETLRYRFGSRIMGVRFNHEFRPSAYASTKGWTSWLQKTDYAMWMYVVVGQSAKWLRLLEDTKQKIHPVAFLERTTGTPYDTNVWSDFRRCYKRWIEYHCQQSAAFINKLADISDLLGLPFYAYPGGRTITISPRLMPVEEYTLDQGLLNSKIIMEAGGWNTRTGVWRNSVAGSIDGPYIWTTQIDRSQVMVLDGDEDYRNGITTRNMAGHGPIGYGLWTDWVPEREPELTPYFQRYLDQLAGCL